MANLDKKQQYNYIMENISQSVIKILNISEKSQNAALNESEKKQLNKDKANKDIEDVCKQTSSKKSKFGLLEKIEKDKYGTNVFQISGGLNGSGEWVDYFKDLAKFVEEISKKYHIWMIEAKNDCLDDVFYFTFGISSL